MASSEKINYADLVDGDAFEKVISNAEALTEALTKMDKAAVDAMKSNRSAFSLGAPGSAKDVENLQKKIKATDDLNTAHQKTAKIVKELTIENAKARIIQQELNKGTVEAAKNELGLTGEYKKQSLILNELRGRYKDLVLTGQGQLQTTKDLQKEISTLDSKLKKVDATVGEHQRNVGNYTGAIQKLGKGLGGVTGLIASFGAAFGVQTQQLEAFHDISKQLIKTVKEFHHATELGEVAEKAAIVTNEEHTASTEASTVATEEQTVAQEANNVAWLASPVGIMVAVGVALAATGFAIYEFTKAEEDSLEAMTLTTQAFADQQKQINSLNETLYEKKIDFKVLTGELTEQQGAIRKLDEKEKEALIKQQVDFNEKVKKLREIYDVGGANNIDDKILRQKRLDSKIAELLKEETILKAAIKDNANIERAIIQQTQINNLADQQKFDDKTEKERERKQKEKDDRVLNEMEELDKKRMQQRENLQKWTEESEAEQTKNESQNIKTISDAEIEAHNVDIDNIVKFREKKKKEQEKQINDEIDFANDLLKIQSDYENKKSEQKLKNIDSELQLNQSAIAQQQELAAKGYANTLDYELKRQDDLQKQRQKEIEDQRKAAKAQEEIALGLAFIKAYEKDLETMKPGQALASAAAEIFAAKALSKSIAGSAFEGVEDTGGEGRLDAKGGKLWMLHPHEGIVNRKANEENPGLVGAMNKGNVEDWFFENIYKPQFVAGMEMSHNSNSNQSNDAIVSLLDARLQSLENTIKNKVENYYNFDNLGNLIHKKFENGNSQTRIKKTYLS